MKKLRYCLLLSFIFASTKLYSADLVYIIGMLFNFTESDFENVPNTHNYQVKAAVAGDSGKPIHFYVSGTISGKKASFVYKPPGTPATVYVAVYEVILEVYCSGQLVGSVSAAGGGSSSTPLPPGSHYYTAELEFRDTVNFSDSDAGACTELEILAIDGRSGHIGIPHTNQTISNIDLDLLTFTEF